MRFHRRDPSIPSPCSRRLTRENFSYFKYITFPSRTRHEPRGTRHAARSTRHAARSTRHETRSTRHTARSTRHAARTPRHEARTPRHEISLSFSSNFPVSTHGDWMSRGETRQMYRTAEKGEARTRQKPVTVPARVELAPSFCYNFRITTGTGARAPDVERLLVWKTGNLTNGRDALRDISAGAFTPVAFPVCVSLRAYQSPQTRPYGNALFYRVKSVE